MSEKVVAHIDESVLRDAPAHDYMLEIEELPRARALRELREYEEATRLTPVRLLSYLVFGLATWIVIVSFFVVLTGLVA